MTNKLKSGLSSLASESQLYPQESLLKVKKSSNDLFIGIPKESSMHEYRVALTPEVVRVLSSNGHRVVVQSGAGTGANYTDNEYSEAGAKITDDPREAFGTDIVLKVEFPTIEELEMIQPGKTVISTIHVGSDIKVNMELILRRKITAIGYEFIQDKVGGLPIVRAMSEIAGSVVVSIAAEYLSSVNNGLGVILGGITGVPPSEVVILGAGTVAEYTARAAIGLGANVKIFDDHIYKLRRLKHLLTNQIYTSTIDHASLERAILNADVLIGAVRSDRDRSKCLVLEETVSQMKKGSVIVDVSIDEGGCIETSYPTTLNQPTFSKYGITHYCVPNIASRVPRTASKVLSNIFYPILLQVSDAGGLHDMLFQHPWFMKGVYAHQGSVTNYYLSKRFNLKFKDLSLLMAARF